MDVHEIKVEGYERVLHATDAGSGLNAFISIHSTLLGPACGGTRMLPYASEAEALADVNRLARAMTYKSAVADCALGGGKCVVIGEPRDKTEALLLALGEFIDRLKGRYITAEDMNMRVADLEIVRRKTRWVAGLPRESGSSGNPSPVTARGCFVGIQACCREVFGSPSLEGRKIAVQGIGAVGAQLAILCLEAGAKVVVSDIDYDKAVHFAVLHRVAVLDHEEAFLAYECDVLSPCARGQLFDAERIRRLKCKIVAGAANNQLKTLEAARAFDEAGVLYAPDYVINAGGIINIACEFLPGGYNEAEAARRVDRIADTLRAVFRLARERRISTAEAADQLAEQRLAQAALARR